MLKRVIFTALLLMSFESLYADRLPLQIDSEIFAATSNTAGVVITAVASQKTCLTGLGASATAGSLILRVLDGGTTVYTVSVSTGQAWQDNRLYETALCGGANSAMTLSVSTFTAGVTYLINYQGYRRTNP